MNTPDRLSPEERALARLLGRPAAVPDPRVDAAIAELARQPAATAPARSTAPAPSVTPHARHRRRRAVVPALTVAASLVLAVGLAWQLRPTPPPLELPVLAEALPPPATAPLPAADVPVPEVAIEPVAPAARMAAPAKAPLPRASVTATDDTARVERARKESSPAVEATSRRVVPPSPPAPPAPLSASPPQADIALPAPAEAAPARLAAAPAPAKLAAPAATTASSDLDADAALPPRQWLQRIRQRHKEGDDEGARASLHRFVEAHPKARIPRDLRPLLEDS
ncbi:putative proline/alanine-rich repetetive membrane anchored protein [uncultured Stenotrophomonas sp.]|uniref:Putative proline/alanine-rich repetetive membrane anchored protein n=1 Tax=uncultured Stenotrophomonas sp. TaxID=165438 RepID=A0A1Y5Q1E3_9GAMM|nr:putative proline/alanine-rich repetetive membrane anchored protein [uncultured Stenotrophomonas sp.]